jgi:methylmalonyl-CoA mutase cobalamin-binding domain/chain
MMVALRAAISPDDIPKLKAEGIAEIFGPGTALTKIIQFIRAKAL